MKQTDTLKRLNAVVKDINGDNTQILRTMQDQIVNGQLKWPEFRRLKWPGENGLFWL